MTTSAPTERSAQSDRSQAPRSTDTTPPGPPGPPGAPGSWPPGVSHTASISIGDVLNQLVAEFPAVTISKLRFLEDQGLVTPARTPAGYRKYSLAEIERLRFVLAAQRDHYWPLRVIKAKLEALDTDGGDQPTLGPRLTGGSAQVGVDEVATLSGASAELVVEVAATAGIDLDQRGSDSALVQAVEAVAELADNGLQVRHLRPVFQAAARQADLIAAAAAAQLGRGSAGRERAAAHAADMAESVARLNQALVRLALAQDGL